MRYRNQGNRNCAAIGCSNSGKQLSGWLKSHCDKHNCSRDIFKCNCEPPFLLFPFPTEKKDASARKIWTKMINRTNENDKKKIWEPTCNSRVCSNHFIDKQPTIAHPHPTLNLGYDQNNVLSYRKPPRERVTTEPPVKRSKPNEPEITEKCASPKRATKHYVSLLQSNCAIANASDNLCSVSNDLDYWRTPEDEAEDCKCDGCSYLTKKVKSLKNTVKRLERELRSCRLSLFRRERRPFDQRLLKSDKKMKFYTGIPSVAAFDAVYDELKDSAPTLNYWRGAKVVPVPTRTFLKQPKKFGPARSLTSREELIMTLMKLRLGLTNGDIDDRFGISPSTVSRIWTTWVKFLSTKLSSLIYLPEKDDISAMMPTSFKRAGLNRVHHIIDCTEVFIETPKNPKAAAQTWSDYKHHNTLKFLVDILPSGLFTFVSKTYGGRASDKFITLDSGFLDTVQRDTDVMADKGFSSIYEDLALISANLRVPPGRRGGEQMSREKGSKTKLIANKRIHVEQAIRRLKTFHLLKFEIPITAIGLLDDIIIVCAAICNLYPPLVK